MKPAELKKLLAVRQKLSAIEAKLRKKMQREMASLPEKYGYSSMESFIAALQELSGGGGSAGKAARGKAEGRRKRGKVTDEVKQKVKALFEAEKTGREVAEAVGLSLPTIQNIKKELKLVKERKG
jgi:hypothetical protein